ncbi:MULTISPECIES: winged helix-turn-helix domain-containing protein [unclassified Serratia (in: enterobacteria)]|uniref:winged helix-turn-helix domain-containing protein n=1 Tax=unclassified Serratia (in: enterobacteria) TaxID=2647522 RepID=UPI0004683E30|nr:MULTISPECIES: winged helix-turn-helix domain-containing protein [unclassified Serratia (in: enterobacteria)]
MDRKKLFGFWVEPDLQIDVKHNRIIRLSADKPSANFSCAIVSLKEVTMAILTYLLKHAGDKFVSRQELLTEVIGKMNYSSSNQFLWQELKELKLKLSLLGIPEDIIITSRSKGISISRADIKPLYY